MAETLFITPAEITGTTIMGGNVDVDKYITNIAFVQVTVIEPLLGTELYDKIKTDFEADPTGLTGLTGDYLTLFTDYIKPITKNTAVAEYIKISTLMLDNGGTFKHVAENREIPSQNELNMLSGNYSSMAQMYIKRFEKWICKNMLPEYKRSQDEVNAQKVNQRSGLFFGKDYNKYHSAEYEIYKDIRNENEY